MRRANATLLELAPFTLISLAANIVLYILTAMQSQNFASMNTLVLVNFGASQRELLWEGEWLRLIAPMFLHGGLLHIFMNMQFLWNAGPDAEIYFGTPNYGTIYLLSGLTGVCLSQIFGGHVSIGASGCLCGIMGAHLAVRIFAVPVLKYAWRNSQVRAAALNLIILLGIGLLGFFRMDNWGHFGGMLGGLMLGSFFELWRKKRRMGLPGLLLTLGMIAALVCAARWTVFNPAYHLYQAAYATEVLKDNAEAQAHFTAARKWSNTWKPLHILGALDPQETDNIIRAYQRKQWNLASARHPGFMMATVCDLFKRARSDVLTLPDESDE